MRKEIVYELTYFKKGQELKKRIPIKFISNRIYDLYADVAQNANDILILTERRKKAIEKLAYLMIRKDKAILQRRSDAKPIKDELKEIEQKIKTNNGVDFLEQRFNLIKRILEDNGVEDTELLSIDFWNDNVEPTEVWGFLTAAITKDTEGKKKAV